MPEESSARVTIVLIGLGLTTSRVNVSEALCPAPDALTSIVAVPSLSAFKANRTISSLPFLNEAVPLLSPTSFKGPPALTETTASFTPFSVAKTLTGRVNSSPGATRRGRLDRTISGAVTGTVFSALPKAFSPAAMSITLTLPTYIGSVTLWTALPPFPRVWGFRYHTTGLKRLSLRAETILSWSPPMAAMVENRPAAAPITSSYMSQVLTLRASTEFITFHGSGVLKAVISRRPSSTMARVYVIGLPLFSLTVTENSSSG